MNKKPKILIVGHGRHGKDTVAEYICKHTNYKAIASSLAAAEIFIFDVLKDKYNYKSFEECFEDRSNHRSEWYDLICDYNKNDKSRLAKDIMKTNDIYTGMRDDSEIEECLKNNIFDYVIGVYDPRKPLEPLTSFNIDIFKVSDIIICNNKGLEELEENVKLVLNGVLNNLENER